MEINKLLKRVIKGEVDKIDLPLTTIDKIETELRSLGIPTNNVDRDSNGWQYDFWYTYKFSEELSFQLSGSLFYGSYKFTKLESE